MGEARRGEAQAAEPHSRTAATPYQSQAIDLNLPSSSHNLSLFHLNNMSSTEDTTTAPSNFQLIIDALVDHANQTGIDLSKNPFAEKIQLLTSPDDILELFEEREKAFKEYRDGNRKLITCLSPAVRVLHALSGILGEAVTLVSHTLSFLCFWVNVLSQPR